MTQLLDKYWGKLLPEALLLAQVGTYGKSDQRRPYVMTGVYTQKLRTTKENVPQHIMQRLSHGMHVYARLVERESNKDKRQLQHL